MYRLRNSISQLPDLDQSFYDSKNLESVFVEIIVPNKSNIIVGTIYRHPCMSVNTFNSNFLKPLIHKVSCENKQTILLEDFNINLLNSDESSDSSEFIDILGSNLIAPQIYLPTRVTGQSKTLIDNIFSSVSGQGATSGNLCYSISDHLPQFCLFHSTCLSKPGKTDIFKQDWCKFDQAKFESDYLDIDWNSIFEQHNFDSDHCFDIFNSKMKDLLDRHVPTVKLTKRQAKTCLLYTSPSPRDGLLSRMPSSA